MPFFNKTTSVAATASAVVILDIPEKVILRSLKIKVHSLVPGAVVAISSNAQAGNQGYPLVCGGGWNGAAAVLAGSDSISFDAEECKTLKGERVVLFASGDGSNAVTVHIMGILEY